MAYNTEMIKYKTPIYLTADKDPLKPTQIRSTYFTEQESMWMLPLYETSLITDLATTITSSGDERVYVSTVSPFALYYFTPGKEPYVHSLVMHGGHFGFSKSHEAKLKIAVLPGGDRIALHEEEDNTLLIMFPESGIVHFVPLKSILKSAVSDWFRSVLSGGNDEDNLQCRMCKDLAEKEGILIFHQINGQTLQIVDTNTNLVYTTHLPIQITDLQALSLDEFVLQDENRKEYILRRVDDQFPNVLYNIEEEADSDPKDKVLQISTPLENHVLSAALQQNMQAPSRILNTNKTLAQIIVGFPELDSSKNEIWTWPRQTDYFPKTAFSSGTSLALPDAGQIIRVVDALPPGIIDNEKNRNIPTSYLEVVDLLTHSISYIPVQRTIHPSAYWRFAAGRYATPLLIAKKGNDGLVSVDAAGGLRLWKTGVVGLERALAEWRTMIGEDETNLRLEIERESGLDVSSPKHGKVDENNDPHVGGNQWAGGTGGRDTAGLGGKGGPYRLDAGHDVHQIPDFEKDAVPEEVRRAAREMGKKAFQDRLQQIRMSEYDADLYNKLSSKVQTQLKAVRAILSSLQARSKERQWLRHRMEGELDDTKLIEGLTGDKNIYRLRREEEPEIGAPQTKPKRLRLVVDMSGSMYRFNGHDGRLERELEVALMVMEAFEGFETKFKYEIYGHSGEEIAVPLVTSDQIPKNNKERLDVLKTMQAHAQFCLSGDHTIQAARHAVKTIAKEEADEHFVILLSDANLERYGIKPKVLADAFATEPDVKSFAIFIGSLGNQADRLTKSLPAGRSFVCLNLETLPQIMQQIFTSALLT